MISNIQASVRENKGGQLSGKATGELLKSENESKKGGFGRLFQSMQQRESNTGEGKTQLHPTADSADSGNTTENAEIKPSEEASILENEQSQNQQVTENTDAGDTEILNTDINEEVPATLETAHIKTGTYSTEIMENLSPETDENNADGNTTKSKISLEKLDGSSKDGPTIRPITDGENVGTSFAGNDEVVKSSLSETGTLIVDELPVEEVNASLNNVASTEAGKDTKVGQSDLLMQPNPSQQENAANASASKNVQNLPDAKNQSVAGHKTAVPADSLKPTVDAKSETKVPVFETSSVQTDTINGKTEIASKDSHIQVQMKGKPEGGVAAPVLSQTSSGSVMQVQEEQTDPQLIKNTDSGKLSVPGASNVSADTERTWQGENTRQDIPAGQKAGSNHAPIKGETLRSILFGNQELRDALHTEQGQNSLEIISEENQNRPIYDAALNKAATSTLGNGIVVENMQNYIREKRQERHIPNFVNSVESANRELQNLTRSADQLPLEKLAAPTQGLFQAGGSISSSEIKILEEELFWKEQMAETSQIKEKNSTEQQVLGFGRLMEIPIYNFSVRRNLLPGLTQAVLKAASGNQAATETWQKHNFSLDNGKNLQVSVRQADGIVYLKLNSSLGELHRLLLQHQDEIRDHLERECNVQIDLQFEGEEDQDLSQFFGGTDSGQKGWKGSSSFTREKNFTETDVQNVQKSIRKFGYNRMEWMA